MVVTTVIAVERAKAFQLFTDDVDKWWKRGPRFRVDASRPSRMRFEPRVGGRFVEAYDDSSEDLFEHGKVRVWDPVDRIVFEMRGRDFQPDERTEVEVRFEDADAAGGKTRVTVFHRGWELLPPDHPVRHGHEGMAFDNLMRTWWAELLVSLQGRGG